MNSQRSLKTLLLITAIAVVLAAPSEVQADENCCLNNYRFAGGCMVVARGSETCESIHRVDDRFGSGERSDFRRNRGCRRCQRAPFEGHIGFE